MNVKDDPNRVGTPTEYDREDTRPRWDKLSVRQRSAIVEDYLHMCPNASSLTYEAVLSGEDALTYIAKVIEFRGKNEDFVL